MSGPDRRRARDQALDRRQLPSLLLLAAGIALCLPGLAGSYWWPAPAGSPSATAPAHYDYRWREAPGQPAGIYRHPQSPPAANLAKPADTPPHLAIFTFQPIAVNRADARTLSFLPGIGPTLARRIVDLRTEQGEFAKPEELLRVHGLGPKTLAAIREGITVD